MPEEQLLCTRAESREDFLSQRARDFHGERIRQRHDVGRPGAKRRNRDHLECESIEQVGAKRSVARERRQIDIGSADHPHVELDGPPSTDPLHLTVLDDPEHLFLHGGRRIRNFVEQQGSAVRTLESADMLALRARERPGFVAEQLRVEQRLGERRTVDLHQRSVPPGREIVQAGGQQLLAGSTFADQETRPVDGRKARDLLLDLQEGGVFTEDGGGNGHSRMISKFA